MRTCLLIMLLCIYSMSIAQIKTPQKSENSVILRGTDYAFSISIPQGWILDTLERPVALACKAVLYTNDSTYALDGINIVTATKKIEGKETLKNLLSYFAKQDSEFTPPVKRVDAPHIVTRDKKTAIIKRRGGGNGYLSATAYIDDRNVVTVITLWRNTEVEFNKSIPAFNEVVESYSSIAIN
jgi:hypothetical protein